jgi:hypothetical protein
MKNLIGIVRLTYAHADKCRAVKDVGDVQGKPAEKCKWVPGKLQGCGGS